MLRILILEGMPMDAELVEYELERAGIPFEVCRVDTRETFVQALDEFQPDVIISDYTLPRFDGMAALALARERTPSTPFLVVTGSVNEETAVRCMKAGASDYLLKGSLSRIGPAIEGALARERARAEQVRAEAALRRSEANLRAIFNNSSQCFVLIDRDGRVRAQNRTAEEWGTRLLGRGLREGADIEELIPGASAAVALALAGHARTVEQCIEDTEGVPHWFELSGAPVVDDAGVVIGVCLSGVNIDERRRAAEALGVSERRFRSLVQNSSDLVTVLKDDGMILYASDSATKILGFPADALTGTNLFSWLPPADADGVQRLITQQDGAGRVSGPVEFTVPNADGRPVWLEAVGTDLRHDPVIGGIVLNSRDVTERKHAEQELRESEQRYRDLFDSASDLVCVAAPDGSFLYANTAWHRAIGYDGGDLSGLRLVDVVHPDDRDRFAQALGRVLEGQPARHLDVTLLARDGRTIVLEGSANCMFKDGAPTMIQGIYRDVTERKQVEEHLRRAERMETAGRLAGGMAHEVNNLMTGVIGFGEFLLRSLGPDDPRCAEVEEIIKAGSRAADVTRQLLAFTRRQFRRPEILSPEIVVTETERMLRRSLGEDHDLVFRFAPDAGPVKADRGQLEQILINLVLNAKDAMSQHGTVTIETALVPLDAAYGHRHEGVVIPPGPYVMLAVSDTGCGMDAETLARIFEPFFTTKPVGQGTGLGLSTVYGIVKQSDGFVWVYSEAGRGTAVKVYLPAVEAAHPVGTVKESSPAPRGSQETILVVEDEDVVRLLARRALAEQGYKVVEARHGRQALEYIAEHPGVVDLVVSDVVMPELGGKELGQRLSRLEPSLPVLYMSGYTGEDIVRRGLLDPKVPFQQKPFTLDGLARRVRELLDQRSRVNVP